MKRKIIFALMLGCSFISIRVKAQETGAYAKIDFIGVSFGHKTPSTSLPCDTSHSYYNPLVISIGFETTNNSNKDYLLFGSNTIGHFMNDSTLYAENGTMGKFFLVNENDSILLFSRKYGREIFAKKSHCTASINYIYENSIFTNLLCKFIDKNELNSLQKICCYLKKSKVVYVPYPKDYEDIIQKNYPEKKGKIGYPENAITIEMPSPLYIAFGKLDDDSSIQIFDEENSMHNNVLYLKVD